jgi:RecA/RadA recombinase
MNDLLKRLKKNSKLESTEVLSKSEFFNEKDEIPTKIPAINVALSGRLDGGLTSGLIQWVGPSKHFKTGFSLLMAIAYMDKYEDAVLLFYDSEFGAPQSYFNSFGIDLDRVLHTPFMNIEELKFDCVSQLENMSREDHVIILIDSIGNAPSKKEIEDALKESGAADMTRAKQLKSFFRMVTPYLTAKNIPMVAINHSYETMELYSKQIVSGGKGSYYSSDAIFILGRQQTKDADGLSGHNFIINVEKSRYVKEKSKIPITISFEDGFSKYSGLIDMALQSGHVIKPKNGWYQRVDMESGEVEPRNYRLADTNNKEFWDPILASPSFNDWVHKTYSVAHNSLFNEEDDIEEVFENLEDNEEGLED